MSREKIHFLLNIYLMGLNLEISDKTVSSLWQNHLELGWVNIIVAIFFYVSSNPENNLMQLVALYSFCELLIRPR